jgi:hypothetical protein
MNDRISYYSPQGYAKELADGVNQRVVIRKVIGALRESRLCSYTAKADKQNLYHKTPRFRGDMIAWNPVNCNLGWWGIKKQTLAGLLGWEFGLCLFAGKMFLDQLQHHGGQQENSD